MRHYNFGLYCLTIKVAPDTDLGHLSMKKCLLMLWFCILTICLFAQNGSRNNNQNASSERPTQVTAAQALEVGYSFMRTSGHERGNGNVNKSTMQLVYTGTVTDSLSRAVTECFYVFSLQPTGFVIVSADERVKPILGYSYNNDFVVEDMPDNILNWLDNYEKQIKAVIDNDFQADQAIRTTWSRLRSGQAVPTRSGTSVNPLLQTTWNQNCYYNQLCPIDSSGPCNRVYAGCVATAMAQVMHYWEWPTQGFNSHSYTCDYGTLSVDFSTATYNHDNMPNAVNSSTSTAQKEEVAKFIYHCGVAVDMDYGPDGSGAYSSDVPAALYNYFAYTDNGTYQYKSNYSDSAWETLIKQELENMRPVYYSGHGTGGHAFVCDGYDENSLFHFNWGWSGSSDGYFELSSLTPSSYDFSSSQGAAIGVQSAGTFMRCSDTELSFSARVGEQSAPQTIMVCGHGLGASISVSVSGDFRVSKNGYYYSTSLTLPSSGGKLYLKYVPTHSGDVTDSLTLTAGSYSITVQLYGTDNVIIGAGSATNIYLPSHSYYKYALTQQIYTPEEIGTSGYINSIAFFNSGTEKTRNYDMYLVLTDKETFTDATDWIAVTEEDRVFSGQVTMAEGTWTVFNIDNFAYDGVSNLALIMDDNTGSYSSGMACRVFNAEDKSIYVYSDGTNYDPFNPYSYSGTILDLKNQIKVDITPATVVICEKPSNLTFSNLTPTSVSVSWSGGSGNFGYEYKKSSDAGWTVVSQGNTGYSCNLTGLTPNTTYQFRVHSFCANDTSNWLGGVFNTPAGIPLVEPFNTSSKPDGWTLYSGLLNNGTATLTPVTSGWTFGTGNGVFNSHARTNIYGSSWNKWLVTPTLLMEDSVQLSFDLALTKYSGTLQPAVDTLQQDDRFVVLITTNNGNTWETLRQWDNMGSAYVYNHIACSADGESVTIDLSAYAGNNIAVAFYGESTASGGDNNLHIDNVSIDYIPVCFAPTDLAVSEIDHQSAVLNWKGEADSWKVAYKTSTATQFTEVAVNTDFYTMTGLQPETAYTVKVATVCGDEIVWCEPISFTTLPLPCYAPTALTAANVTSTSASLNWTENGTATSWVLQYGTDDAFANDTYTTVNVSGTPAAELVDLTAETQYYARVKTACNADEESDWSNICTFFPSIYLVIGSGTATNNYLPTNVNNKYSMTQQIYTAEELGEAGNILSLDFYKNNDVVSSRKLDIYMVSTDKSSFTGTNDWIPVAASDKVFSGTVNFNDNAWTTITLDRPFSYAGTSNVAIVVDDNTGLTKSSTPFRVFSATDQAIYICSNRTNYNVVSASNYTGTVLSSKNQMRVVKGEFGPYCPAPTDVTVSNVDRHSAVVTWTENGDATSWVVSYCVDNQTNNPSNMEVSQPTCTLTDLMEGMSYVVKVRPVCDNITESWSDQVSFTTASCYTISLYAEEPVWTETFEGYTQSTVTATGEEPECWVLIPDGVDLDISTKPQLYGNFNTTEDGGYTLRMKNRCIYATPLMVDVDIAALTMTFNLRQPKTVYRLQVGVINSEGEFELVKEINNSGTEMEQVEVDFSNFTGYGNRIAFRNTLRNGTDLDYSVNYIDDIRLSYNSLSCGIGVPYAETFDTITYLTVAETGAQPDCWETITEDVALNDVTMPQVYYTTSYATSGSYVLRMKNRCTYVMPRLNQNIAVNELTMTFNLRQPNSKYRLQVGVLSDEGEFMLVKTLKCSGTSAMEAKTVDFSGYTGNGHRIAFRNTLVPGTGSSTTYLDYSVNYIDDINLDYTELAKNDEIVIAMNADLDNIEVYPNPTTDYVNVECTMNNVQSVELIDVYGKVVRTDVETLRATSLPTRINVSGLAAGLYFVRVATDRGVVTKTFVKR